MRTVRLLGIEESVYWRIGALALAEKGVPYELEHVDVFDEDRPASYLHYHPFNRMPCLIHDDFVIYETVAITRYVDEYFAGPSLQPATAAQRARMTQVQGIIDAYAYRPMVWELFVERCVNPSEGLACNESVVQAALPQVDQCLQVLSRHLGAGQWLASEEMSLADLHAVPVLHYLTLTPEGGERLAAHHNLFDWLSRMRTRSKVNALLRNDPWS